MKMKLFKAFLVASIFAITACTGQQGPSGNRGPQGSQGEQGPAGENGVDGISIVSIAKTGSNGLVDSYTITYSNGDTSTFTVTNGEQGEQGIQGNPGQDGHSPIITISSDGYWVIDGTKTSFSAQGQQGQNGVSVTSIIKTSSNGLVDTYTITYSNGNTSTFTVTNGEQGLQGNQGNQGEQGVSVVSTTINDDGDLIFTFSNGQVVNAGHIRDVEEFTVTFHIGSKIISTKQVSKGSTVSKPTAEETYGYNVTDWYYLDGETHESWKFFAYVVTKDIDLYAEYTVLEKHTISFVDNEHSQTAETISLYSGEGYTLPTISFPRYTFLGWKDSYGSLWSQTGSFNYSINITLFATWQQSECRVTLNPNGGTVDPSYVDVVYDLPYELPAPSKIGFSFGGWFNSSLEHIPSNGTWAFNSDMTLTAKWIESEPYLYVFDLNGGRCSSDSINLFYGSDYSLPTPYKSGNFFNGWYLNDKYIPNNGVWTSSIEAGTLVAHWVPTSTFTFKLKDDNSYMITECNYSESELLIVPDRFNSLGVTELTSYLFLNKTNLISVIIPDSITRIGSSIFSGCSSLESLTIPFVGATNGVSTASSTTLFGYLFGQNSYAGGQAVSQYYNSNSSTTYYIPSALRHVVVNDGYLTFGAFYGCDMITSITLGNGVSNIGSKAFYSCANLISITIPDSVTSINEYAFSDCSSLCSVVIPDSVSLVGGYAFYNCTSLTSAIVPALTYNLGWSCFKGCSSLESLTIGGEYLLGYYFGDESFDNSQETTQADTMYTTCTYYIPSTLINVVVTSGSLHYGIFSGCSGLTSITLLSGVSSIREKAFIDCSNLVSLLIEDGLTDVGRYAFKNCTSLSSLVIPGSVTKIEEDILSGCSSLESLTIPFVGKDFSASSASSTTLFGYFFGKTSYSGGQNTSQRYGNSSVYSVVYCIPVSLKSVTVSGGNLFYGAFYGCSKLVSIVLGSGVSSIESNAFRYCSSLTSIIIPGSVSTISTYAFADCSSLTSVIIGDGVNTIGNSAFYNCIGLASVTIGNGVTSIGNSAFRYCSNLVSVVVPDGVTSIGEYAFADCTNLESIVISDGVTSIGNSAFNGCSNLTSITIPDSVTSIGDGAFYGCTSLASISIPDGVEILGASMFGDCSNLNNVAIGNGVTSIGNSAFRCCSNLTSITIPDSVTSIGNSAFYGCTSLASVTIGNGVTSIGEYAFSQCTNLTSIAIPKNVSNISSHCVFDGCINLNISIDSENPYYQSINNVVYSKDLTSLICCTPKIDSDFVIPDGVISIGDYAFYDCDTLASIIIPDSVESINDTAFYSCSNLALITIGNGVTSIGSCSFYGCISLTSIIIPNSVTSIGTYSFAYCSKLTSVTISNSITAISDYAFNSCKNLASIIIHNGVTSIGTYSFSGCSNLESVLIPNSVTSIGTYAFYNCSSLTTVFYAGNAVSWTSISMPSNVATVLTAGKTYFYSEEFPKDAGNYWHYVDGVPTIW